MKYFVLISTLVLAFVEADRIAIIGGGIAGGSSAAFLYDEAPANDKPEIVVFEALDRVGGRLKHMEVDGKVFEVGGSIIYDGNRHVCGLARRVGFELEPPKNHENRLGLWDGRGEFVFEDSEWKVVTVGRMLWRWGLGTMRTMEAFVWDMLERFNQVYELQGDDVDKRRAFEEPEELWTALGLYDMSQKTFSHFLEEQFGEQRALLAAELVEAINRVNYNQDNSLNALAGAISMCPLVTGEVVTMDKGNGALPAALFEMVGADVKLGTVVNAIERTGDSSYAVHTSKGSFDGFDAIVLALPAALSSIDFQNMGGKARPVPEYSFVVTHSTWVRGVLRPEYFGGRSEVPGTILLADGAPELFSAVQRYHNYDDGTMLYKLFSPEELPESLLNDMFHPGWTVVEHEPWKAYPRFAPPERFASFRLFDGEKIFYPNAIETGASAMEISAVGAKNVAMLIGNELGWTSTVDDGSGAGSGSSDGSEL